MYVCTTTGVISLEVIRDGVPKLAICYRPLGNNYTGTAVNGLFCLFSSIETRVVACFFVTMGLISENELLTIL